MKIFRAMAAVAFFAALSVSSVYGQAKPAVSPAGPAPTSAGPVNIPESKIALIDAEEFMNEKSGILRLVSAAKKVDAEFQVRRTELQNLQAQITKATDDLNKVMAVQSAQANQTQAENIERMKTDFKRKGEDAQTAYQKRLQDVLGPVYEEIGKALDTFAKARGITLILDVAKTQGIVSASESLDITKAFIAEFNSKNPATAALAPQK
jgi:outer membrane protein